MSRSRDDNRPKQERASPRHASDDAALWRRVAANVRPLKHREPPPIPEAPDPTPPPRAPFPRPIPRLPLPAEAAPPPPPTLPPLDHGAAPGLDRRTAQRLRRGRLPVEARIDLHGHTEATAHRSLVAFIDGAQAAGRRCVLVVTGKGLRPDGQIGILRRNVPHWLNTPPLREKVLAFDYATPRDGGEGAIYVLLKRAR